MSGLPSAVLFFHGAAGNWDEVALVAVGLGVAWAAIVFYGRGRRDDADTVDSGNE